jgi:hypothetical protein
MSLLNNFMINPRLESQLASELGEMIRHVPVGGQFGVPPSANFCMSLELFIPQQLRSFYPEWDRESLDGIFVARAEKTGLLSAHLVGTCIIISDQTVTPFSIDLELSSASVSCFKIMLGEPGGGALGISGPKCNSREAKQLFETLINRLGSIDWSYTMIREHRH